MILRTMKYFKRLIPEYVLFSIDWENTQFSPYYFIGWTLMISLKGASQIFLIIELSPMLSHVATANNKLDWNHWIDVIGFN